MVARGEWIVEQPGERRGAGKSPAGRQKPPGGLQGYYDSDMDEDQGDVLHGKEGGAEAPNGAVQARSEAKREARVACNGVLGWLRVSVATKPPAQALTTGVG